MGLSPSTAHSLYRCSFSPPFMQEHLIDELSGKNTELLTELNGRRRWRRRRRRRRRQREKRYRDDDDDDDDDDDNDDCDDNVMIAWRIMCYIKHCQYDNLHHYIYICK